ncbi:S8 family serine peptidase [Allonocardiopsis opalescens]|uniref:Subtilisin family serine protease n=1 Tax=Allonocardiopsis opalescens TaxID=1144618 RepID=A0A2T0Q6F3_9ACTN|nr:S8 family serine peptidase [Allonocardiopsis opalescens]PRX99410.1 subtilisin family serine protease [Allonocardiopsis opalescens]
MRVPRPGRGRRRRPAAGTVATGLAAAVLAALGATAVAPGSPAHAEPGDAGPAGVLPASGSWTVTLLTGDVVEVTSDADGRARTAVPEPLSPYRVSHEPDGDVLVIPRSVTPLLGGVLDPELFNVTSQVRQGYDDESSDTIPLIVQREAGADAAAALAAETSGRQLPSISAVAAEVAKGEAEQTGEALSAFAAEAAGPLDELDGVTHVWLDGRVTTAAGAAAAAPAAAAEPAPDLDRNLVQVGAPAAWAAGYTGAGVTVAVLDTGADTEHPDLAGRIGAVENFSDAEDALDRDGHGTHVAATVAGTGAGSGGARSGVAPDAQLIIGKVLNDWGEGTESGIIAGMEWAAQRAEVVNMSLGSSEPSDGTDPMSLALDALTEEHGTLFVVAAGNSGPLSGTIGSPGAAARALTVGAVDGSDALAEFSSRGPLPGGGVPKPDLSAPGVDIVAARAAGTTMGEPVDELYTAASGTSMATPHVAGAAAVLAQRHPDWTPQQLTNALVGSADELAGDAFDTGSGRLDLGAAVAGGAVPGQDSVYAQLPEPREEPFTQELSWTNTGDGELVLDLAAGLRARSGGAEAGVSLEPAELVLAPGETGTATLTVDAAGLANGLYTGMVTATGAGTAARTPLAVDAQPPLVDLTIATTPLPGTAAEGPEVYYSVVNLDDFGVYGRVGGFTGESTTLRVPAGRYAVTGDIATGDPDYDVVALAGDPDVAVTGATTVVFDGAAARPVHPRVEGADTAPPGFVAAGLLSTPAAGTGGFALLTDEVYSWYPQPPVHVAPMEGAAEVFAGELNLRLQAPHLSVEAGGAEISAVELGSAGLPAGERTLPAVDAGDGTDLSGSSGALAVVALPAEGERAAVTERAAQAGAAAVAFVDESRPGIAPSFAGYGWAEVPVIAAGGEDAAALLAAASAGGEVSLAVAGSPYVYDLVLPLPGRMEPEPVVDAAAQRELAVLQESFHRDADGTGPDSDRRYYLAGSLMNLDSVGPLPQTRTAYLSPGVPWQSMAIGTAVDAWFPEGYSAALAQDAGAVYQAGAEQEVAWVTRPQWPGFVGAPQGASTCQPTPPERTAERMDVWLAPFQDGRDRYGCADPLAAELSLEVDGEPVATHPAHFAQFEVPAGTAEYRLSYQQEGQAPYRHRSSTAWTFTSAAPAGGGTARLPLLGVDYRLPLDTLNRPQGGTAVLEVAPVTGTDPERIRRFRVWTSTDSGETWVPARVSRAAEGRYELRLPRVAEGTGVSLRVDALDARGSRIEQVLYDAYRG